MRNISVGLIIFVILAGCSAQERFHRKPTVKASGTVFYKGQPAKGAIVIFAPVNGTDADNAGAQAKVSEDGSFQLTTYTSNDGVLPGDYTVLVVWPDETIWNPDHDNDLVDKLKGAYAAGHSKIRRTITEGQLQIERIDLK
jgi:hypothetical protein